VADGLAIAATSCFDFKSGQQYLNFPEIVELIELRRLA
jgi:hypothetical protein